LWGRDFAACAKSYGAADPLDLRRIGSLSCLPFDLAGTGASRISDPGRLPENLMQHYLSILTDVVGVVHIDRHTGVMFWEQEDLDPALKQYAKKYIIDEGFLEQALGALEPLPVNKSMPKENCLCRKEIFEQP
jgi:hypothetical protein